MYVLASNYRTIFSLTNPSWKMTNEMGVTILLPDSVSIWGEDIGMPKGMESQGLYVSRDTGKIFPSVVSWFNLHPTWVFRKLGSLCSLDHQRLGQTCMKILAVTVAWSQNRLRWWVVSSPSLEVCKQKQNSCSVKTVYRPSSTMIKNTGSGGRTPGFNSWPKWLTRWLGAIFLRLSSFGFLDYKTRMIRVSTSRAVVGITWV